VRVGGRWGYNTEEERRAAGASEAIELLPTEDAFFELVRKRGAADT
jgi:hypothetical protein